MLNAEVRVLTVVTADSRTFEDHQITNSVGIICHYGLACWGGGGSCPPCPIARYGLGSYIHVCHKFVVHKLKSMHTVIINVVLGHLKYET